MNGYNGIGNTDNIANIVAVTLQTIFSNWLGPIWWSLASLRLLLAWCKVQTASAAALSNEKGSAQASDEAGTASAAVLDNLNGTNAEHCNSVHSGATGLDRSPKTTLEKASRSGSIAQGWQWYSQQLTLQTMFTASHALAVMCACLRLREEPTLWTVLAPKYVFVAVDAVFHHLVIDVGLCSGIWAIVAK